MDTNLRFLRNVILKGLGLFVLANLIFAAWDTQATVVGQMSLYNRLFPGRPRFPFGENSAQAYNLSMNNLDAMFASHELAGAQKSAGEYRVLVIGDSSVWGTLLRPEQTLTGRLNAAGLHSCDGRTLRFYNLGYPTLSLTKDLLILSAGMRYQPDLVLWPITLEALPKEKQLVTPLVANNPQRVQTLIRSWKLDLDPQDPAFVRSTFWQRTLVGQRRPLADWIRLQLYGVAWSATGIDQYYPDHYEHAQVDQKDDASFHDWQPGQMTQSDLSFDVLHAGAEVAGSVPVLVVNEPMLISTGAHSDVRYNLFYPRWAYDQYRRWMAQLSPSARWQYIDLGDRVDASQFTNSAIHLTPTGEQIFATALAPHLTRWACNP